MTAIAQSTYIDTTNTWIRCSDNTIVDGITVNINIVNTNDLVETARVDVAITDDPLGPNNSSFLENYAPVSRGNPLLRTGEPFKEGEALFVRTGTPGIAVRFSGYNRL